MAARKKTASAKSAAAITANTAIKAMNGTTLEKLPLSQKEGLIKVYGSKNVITRIKNGSWKLPNK